MTTYAEDATEPKTGTDRRIDTLGFGDDLGKLFLNDLRTEVKIKMVKFGFCVLEGATYQGKLAASTERTIDPRKFFKLVKEGAITEKEFLGAIKVGLTEAAKVLHPNVLARITAEASGSPRLSIARKKGVEMKLVDALEGLRNDAGML